MELCGRMSALPRDFFDKALHRDSELPEEPFDNGPTFCKLVLHLDVQDVCHECNKGVFLQRGKTTDKHAVNLFKVIYNT